MQHEDMLTKLDAAFQSGDAPDVYMERGGGELADHVEAGLTKDISESAADDDRARSAAPSPAGRWTARRTRCRSRSASSASGTTRRSSSRPASPSPPPRWTTSTTSSTSSRPRASSPLSVGAGDKWPAAHYWYYYALRECSQDVLDRRVADARLLRRVLRQGGRGPRRARSPPSRSTPASSPPRRRPARPAPPACSPPARSRWSCRATGSPASCRASPRTARAWARTPAGSRSRRSTAARATDGRQLGGGDAWAVSQDAPDEAVEFVQYLLSRRGPAGLRRARHGPADQPDGAAYVVSDPALAELLEVRDDAPYVQLYFDTAFGASVGGAMNDEIALLFAGKATPQDIVDADAGRRGRGEVTDVADETTARVGARPRLRRPRRPRSPVAPRRGRWPGPADAAGRVGLQAAGDRLLRGARPRPVRSCSWSVPWPRPCRSRSTAGRASVRWSTSSACGTTSAC